jgi:hypothetical protein
LPEKPEPALTSNFAFTAQEEEIYHKKLPRRTFGSITRTDTNGMRAPVFFHNINRLFHPNSPENSDTIAIIEATVRAVRDYP